jgi:hypothetical protein
VDHLAGLNVAHIYYEDERSTGDDRTMQEVRGIGEPVERRLLVEIPDGTQRRTICGYAGDQRALKKGVDIDRLAVHMTILHRSGSRQAPRPTHPTIRTLPN